MTEFRWYVAQALAGLEATALYHLNRAGITAYAPADADRKARYFPGYVFVELEGASEAGIVNRTRGIHKVLPIHAKSPLPLPNGFVDWLRDEIAGKSLEKNSGDDLLRRFVKNDEVFVTSGPFEGHRGKFLRTHKGAGQILSYLLGREIELPIPLHQLSPVPRDRGERGARRVEDLAAA